MIGGYICSGWRNGLIGKKIDLVIRDVFLGFVFLFLRYFLFVVNFMYYSRNGEKGLIFLINFGKVVLG